LSNAECTAQYVEHGPPNLYGKIPHSLLSADSWAASTTNSDAVILCICL